MGLERVLTVEVGEGGGSEIGGRIELRHFTQSIDLPSVALEAIVNVDAAVTGLAVGDIPLAFVPPEGSNVNLQIVPLGPVALANTLRLRVENESAAAVDEAALTYHAVVMRP